MQGFCQGEIPVQVEKFDRSPFLPGNLAGAGQQGQGAVAGRHGIIDCFQPYGVRHVQGHVAQLRFGLVIVVVGGIAFHNQVADRAAHAHAFPGGFAAAVTVGNLPA